MNEHQHAATQGNQYVGFAVSQQQIRYYANLGQQYTVDVEGDDWLIRSDFPVIVLADGVPITLGGPFPRVVDSPAQVEYRQHAPWIRLRRPVRRFGFALTAGFGAELDGQLYGTAGVCVVEGVPGNDIEPQQIVPAMLPTHCFRFTVPLNAASNTGTLSTGITAWEFLFSTATEVYITSLAVYRHAAGVPEAVAAIRSVSIQQSNNPVGDGRVILQVCGDSPSWSVPLPHFKLPILSHFTRYTAAAGARTLDINTVHDAVAGAQSALVCVNVAFRH